MTCRRPAVLGSVAYCSTVSQPSLEKGRTAGRILHSPSWSGLPVVEILPTELTRGRTAGPPV